MGAVKDSSHCPLSRDEKIGAKKFSLRRSRQLPRQIFEKKNSKIFFFDFFKLFLNFIGLSNDNLQCAKFSNFYPFWF